MKQTTLKELGEVVKNNRTYVVKDDESMETPPCCDNSIEALPIYPAHATKAS